MKIKPLPGKCKLMIANKNSINTWWVLYSNLTPKRSEYYKKKYTEEEKGDLVYECTR